MGLPVITVNSITVITGATGQVTSRERLNSVMISEQMFVGTPGAAPMPKQTSRQRLQTLAQRAHQRWAAVEHRRLDPLVDQALALWGDRRRAQHRAVGATALVHQLTAEERYLNRGLYLCAGSLGIAIP